MSDQYEVLEDAGPERGFFQKIGDSIKGIFFGFIMFVAAFPLLFWGENRQNLAEFVQKAKEVTASEVSSLKTGELIKTTGKFATTEQVLDSRFLKNLGSVKALKLNRKVEMYAWVEKKKTKKVKGTDGKTKKKTTYNYVKEWTSMPQDSSNFYQSAKYINPSMTEKRESFIVSSATVGGIAFQVNKTSFYSSKSLPVKKEMVVNDNSNRVLQLSSGMIYLPHGEKNKPSGFDFSSTATKTRDAASTPMVGDMRVSYTYVPSEVTGSVVGSWDGNQIAGHYYGETDYFLGAFAGSLKDFQATLQGKHNTMSWVIRIASFFMMWIGLNMLLGPVILLIGSVPFLGDVGKGVISLLTGVLAFVLWILTFLLANLWLVLIVLAIIGGGAFFLFKKKQVTGVQGTPST